MTKIPLRGAFLDSAIHTCLERTGIFSSSPSAPEYTALCFKAAPRTVITLHQLQKWQLLYVCDFWGKEACVQEGTVPCLSCVAAFGTHR